MGVRKAPKFGLKKHMVDVVVENILLEHAQLMYAVGEYHNNIVLASLVCRVQ